MYVNKVGIPSGFSGYLDYYTASKHNHDRTWFEINANQFGQMLFNPRYTANDNQGDYSTSFKDIDWGWFLLFNPFIL